MGIMSGSSSVDTVNAGGGNVEKVTFGSVKVFAKTGKILCTVQFSEGENGSCQIVILDSAGNETYRNNNNTVSISASLPGISGGTAWANVGVIYGTDNEQLSYGVNTPSGYEQATNPNFTEPYTGNHTYWWGERYRVATRYVYCREI